MSDAEKKLAVHRVPLTAVPSVFCIGGRCRWPGVGGLVLLAVALAPWGAQAGDNNLETTAWSTPPGITLVEVRREGFLVSSGYLWTRLGDAEGRTLFVSDNDVEPGVSHCRGECAQTFPPVMALPGSKEARHWTLVPREEGGQQWAYQGKPLYRFAKETRINEVVENLLAAEAQDSRLTEKTELHDSDKVLMPPAGWHVARFQPMARAAMPANIEMREIPSLNSQGFVNARGMTLYAFAGKPDEAVVECGAGCVYQWQPLVMPELAREVGDFTAMALRDGRRQWAYQGAPLFRYSGDLAPGDVNGLQAVGDGRRWRVAGRVPHFMPAGVEIRDEIAHGKVLSTADGKPLYSRNPHERNPILERLYRRGKLLGAKGCDAKCLQIWRPLTAPANAQPCGFWEILQRDGVRQWVYKGFAQYINTNDQPHGRATADNVYDYVVDDVGRYPVEDIVAIVPGLFTPTGFYWEATVP